MFTFKKKSIPVNEKVEAKSCIQLWYVKWISRHGAYSCDVQKETEAFTNEQEANDFKLALENAFKILKHTSQTNVTMEKAK